MFSEQKVLRSILVLTIVLFGCLASTKAQTSEINYQGSLKFSGAPANGSYDMQFQLFDAVTGGAQISSSVSISNVPVSKSAILLRRGLCMA